VSATELQS